MQDTQHTADAASTEENAPNPLAGKDWFTTYTVFARPNDGTTLAPLEGPQAEDAVREFDALVAELGEQGVNVRGAYDVSGMRADADVMVWMYGQVPEDLQAAIRRIRRTRLFAGTRIVLSAMGADRLAEFNKEHVPAFAMGRDALEWLCFYPFVRSYDWYTMEPKERARMLREHGLLGRDFPQVWANTTSAFALNDWEWLLGLEAPKLTDLVDMMRHLRDNETRHYVREEVPFYTGRLIDTAEILEVLA